MNICVSFLVSFGMFRFARTDEVSRGIAGAQLDRCY